MAFNGNSIAKVGAIALVIRQLLGLVIDTIQLAEQAIPASGQGASKLALVKATIAAAVDKIEGLSVTFEEIWPRLAGIVAAWVTLFNSVGAFRKGPAPTPGIPTQ